ncbi:NCS1 family nucleobase:cation symporter-1 [Rhodococcus wratislaviensis]|nr:cytosine permease [Rhodococcus wratislaviensis]
MRPLRPDERRWTWWNYSTIWMGIVHNIVAWEVAANLIAIGMSFWQALACVCSAYFIAFLAILANSVLGAKYGLSFPVLIRSAFGRNGAQVPVALRALIAVFWFAVHIYIGSKAIAAVLSSALPGYSSLQQYHLFGMNVDVLIAFLVCWALHAWIMGHGIQSVRRFEVWAGPSIMILAIGLVIWAAMTAGGFGQLVHTPSTIAPAEFWPTFAASMTALLGTVATLILNISDLTRFSRSQKDQALGQGLGFPIMFFAFSAMSLLVAVGTKNAFGEVVTNPIDILTRFDNPLIAIFGGLCILVATASVNVATNGVSTGFDLTNLWPDTLTFKRSGLIAVAAAVVFCPWLWYDNATLVTEILGIIGATMAPVSGIMLADFYFVRKRRLSVAGLFTESPAGPYAYTNGWNPRALTAFALGVLAAVSGLLIPGWDDLYAYSWFLGIAFGGGSYMALMARHRRSTGDADIAYPDVDPAAIP